MKRLLPELGPLLLSFSLLAACAAPAQAQLLRKPSAYDSGAGSPVDASGNRVAPASLSTLASRADFDRLARTYDPVNSSSAMPHVLFAIDRQSKPARLYFINTPRYAFHEDFLHAKGLLRGDQTEPRDLWRPQDGEVAVGRREAAHAGGEGRAV